LITQLPIPQPAITLVPAPAPKPHQRLTLDPFAKMRSRLRHSATAKVSNAPLAVPKRTWSHLRPSDRISLTLTSQTELNLNFSSTYPALNPTHTHDHSSIYQNVEQHERYRCEHGHVRCSTTVKEDCAPPATRSKDCHERERGSTGNRDPFGGREGSPYAGA
jgi:hypothetical protein